MREKYDRINWVNGDESLATPLSADNLNRMDKAIFEISETMDDLNLDAKAEEIRSLVVQAQDYSAAAEESAKKAMSTTPEGYEKIALAVRTNELAYLGWSVPYEMPIQNYVDANRVFHQRVGRVEISNITWILRTDKANVFEGTLTNKATSSNTVANMYCSGYATDTEARVFNRTTNKTISAVADGKRIRVFDTSFSNVADFVNSLKGVYLYYELATEITFNADGNEKIVSFEKHFEVNNFSVPHENKNLIPLPYADTSVSNRGISYVLNEDGTIIANGTVTETSYDSYCVIINSMLLEKGTYCISDGTSDSADNKHWVEIYKSSTEIARSSRSNGIFTLSEDSNVYIQARVFRNTTVNNLVFKPTLVKGTEIPNCLGWLDSSALVGKALGKNLLNTTFTTTTIGGVTCESLGNGAYRLNGTASGNVSFWIIGSDTEYPLFLNGKYKMIGFKNPTNNRTVQAFNGGWGKSVLDTRNGVINPITNVSSDYFRVRIYCGIGEVFNNEIVKPMLVNADLYPNVTYDDFEKWQGLTSADATKYTKYAKIETDKYGADFIPQYVDYLPNGFCFTDAEQDDLSLLENGVHFLDDGILLLAESTPSTDVNLRIGGVL